jgi:hypothetical protein
MVTKQNANRRDCLSTTRRDSDTYNGKVYATILEKLHERGWAAYEERFKDNRDIEAGPARTLKPQSKYIVLPVVKDSKNLDSIFEKLEEIAVKRGRKMPTITIEGKEQPWTGFVMRGDSVKVSTPSGPVMSCGEFADALDTILYVALAK